MHSSVRRPYPIVDVHVLEGDHAKICTCNRSCCLEICFQRRLGHFVSKSISWVTAVYNILRTAAGPGVEREFIHICKNWRSLLEWHSDCSLWDVFVVMWSWQEWLVCRVFLYLFLVTIASFSGLTHICTSMPLCEICLHHVVGRSCWLVGQADASRRATRQDVEIE